MVCLTRTSRYRSKRWSWLVPLLPTPAQITEGKKLVEPIEVSIEEEDEAYFLDQEYSGLHNEDIWKCTL